MLDVLEGLVYLFAFIGRGLIGIFGHRDESMSSAADVVAGVLVVIIAMLTVGGAIVVLVR